LIDYTATVRLIVVLFCMFAAIGCQGRGGCTGAAPREKRLRVVAYNVYWHQHGIDKVAETILSQRPDVVLLSEVPPRDVPPLAQKLNLRGPDGELHYYVTPNNPNEWALPSTAIISRLPLQNSHPIPNPGGRDFAVMSDLTFADKRVAIAAIHCTATRKITPGAMKEADAARAQEIAALQREWTDRGKPPLIGGGDFNQLASGSNYRAMKEHFTDALATLGKTDWTCAHGLLKTRVDYILTTPDFKPCDGGVVGSNASDHRLIWVELTPP
jgi:endonuclease/exonuclease/phosphatase family metal-dependent hydrolase